MCARVVLPAHTCPMPLVLRWQKLNKSFYNEKKDRFDISKIPDIYDSAKYDAIHNTHLGLDVKELYAVSKQVGVGFGSFRHSSDVGVGFGPLLILRVGSLMPHTVGSFWLWLWLRTCSL